MVVAAETLGKEPVQVPLCAL